MSEAMTKQPDPLREWWDELTPDDQWEAFRIEKSNADAALRVTDTHTEPTAPDPIETFSHPWRAPVVIDGHRYIHTSDCEWESKP